MAISKNEFALKNIQEKLQYLFENGGESGGGGGAVKVDNFISSSSENPVQNKVLFSDLIFKGTKEEYNIHKNNLLNNHIVILTNKDDKGTYLYTDGSLLKIADVTTITDDLKTVDTGTALDARQGKKLLDNIDIIKNNLGGFSFKVKNGTYGYEYKSIFTPFGAEISPDQSNILSFKDGLYVPKPTDKVDINTANIDDISAYVHETVDASIDALQAKDAEIDSSIDRLDASVSALETELAKHTVKSIEGETGISERANDEYVAVSVTKDDEGKVTLDSSVQLAENVDLTSITGATAATATGLATDATVKDYVAYALAWDVIG